MTSKVGVDIGYGFLKVSNGVREWILPSVVGAGREVSYRSEFVSRKAEEDNLTVEIEGSRYFVGALAVRQSGLAVRSLVENRPADPNARILFLSALALAATHEDEVFHVVTGLPAAYLGAYEKDLAQMITGSHSVVLLAGDKPIEKKFTVQRARVIPQPFGTLYNLFLDGTGNVQNSELSESLVGIIDIGYRTCDFAVSDRMEYVERMSFSTTMGLSQAYDTVAAGLLREHRISKRSYELDPIMHSGALRIAGKNHDVSALRDQAYRDLAERVVTEAESVWSSNDLDAIYLTGGGGQALAPYLLPHFSAAVLVDAPQTANVHGYLKLANKVFTPW